MLVDTGACISLLSAADSHHLGFAHWFGRARVLEGISGCPFVVRIKSMEVLLGNVMHEIPVGVSCSRSFLSGRKGDAIGGDVPTTVLGCEGVLENFLLCVDSCRLYAFRRKTPQVAGGNGSRPQIRQTRKVRDADITNQRRTQAQTGRTRKNKRRKARQS